MAITVYVLAVYMVVVILNWFRVRSFFHSLRISRICRRLNYFILSWSHVRILALVRDLVTVFLIFLNPFTQYCCNVSDLFTTASASFHIPFYYSLVVYYSGYAICVMVIIVE